MITNPNPQAAAEQLRSQLGMLEETDPERLAEAFVRWADLEITTRERGGGAFSTRVEERLVISLPPDASPALRRLCVVSCGAQSAFLTWSADTWLACAEWGSAFAQAFLGEEA